MSTSRTAPPSAAATLEPGAAAAAAGADVARLAGRWPLSAGMDGARALAAATGTDNPLTAAVRLAAALPPRTGAGGARALTREYSFRLSSYSADTCEPLPAFNTARGAGVAGDAIRAAQPGIEYELLVRDRGTTEWSKL